MKTLKDKFLNQLEAISKLEMMQALTSFVSGEDALLLKLYLKEANNPKQLSKALNVTKGRITAITNSLKKKTYLDTKKNKLDGRYLDLVLTENGIQYIEKKLSYLDKYFENLLIHIGENESNKLVDILDVLLLKLKNFEVKDNG
jgi:DNA-binding MarR family transcriptional regulator